MLTCDTKAIQFMNFMKNEILDGQTEEDNDIDKISNVLWPFYCTLTILLFCKWVTISDSHSLKLHTMSYNEKVSYEILDRRTGLIVIRISINEIVRFEKQSIERLFLVA